MTATSKNLLDQTAVARPRRRSSQPRPDRRKTPEINLVAGKLTLKTAANRPPPNPFAETKPTRHHRCHNAKPPISHSPVAQQNRR